MTAPDLQSQQNGSNPAPGPPGVQSLPAHPHLAPLNTSNTGLPPNPNNLSSPPPSAILSPGGSVRRAAPEPNKQALYIGGLDPRVTEEVLKQIFETTGPVMSVKIIPDKNVSLCPSFSLLDYLSCHYRCSGIRSR